MKNKQNIENEKRTFYLIVVHFRCGTFFVFLSLSGGLISTGISINMLDSWNRMKKLLKNNKVEKNIIYNYFFFENLCYYVLFYVEITENLPLIDRAYWFSWNKRKRVEIFEII